MARYPVVIAVHCRYGNLRGEAISVLSLSWRSYEHGTT